MNTQTVVDDPLASLVLIVGIQPGVQLPRPERQESRQRMQSQRNFTKRKVLLEHNCGRPIFNRKPR